MEDLRKQPRIQPLVIRARVLHKGESRSGYLVNLSEGGAFLAGGEPLAVGDLVELSVALPWALGRLEARAKVVWRTEDFASRDQQQPEGFGLAFVDLSDEARGKIRLYTQRFFQLAGQLEGI